MLETIGCHLDCTAGRPQQVHFGESTLDVLPSLFQTMGARHILLVVDENAYGQSGAEAILHRQLPTDAVQFFMGFQPNPKMEDVERGVRLCHSASSDLVVAIGGGTAIDLAKMIASLGRQDAAPREVVRQGLPLHRGSLPLIAVPTTAGTGSEATHFAVVYLDGEKYSVADRCLLPSIAVIDPRLTYSLPPKITAATGLDAFCQAVESIWSVGATDESVAYATIAARLAMENLGKVTREPTPASRSKLCEASHLAGKAINITKTTLPHAISYALTTEYGMPHGIAVATTLSRVLEYNWGVSEEDCADPRGVQHVRSRLRQILKILEASNVTEGSRRIESFLQSLEVPPTLQTAGIHTDEQFQRLVSRVNSDRLANNPRMASPESLLALLRRR